MALVSRNRMLSIFRSSGAAAGLGVAGAFATFGTTGGAGAGFAATLATAGGLVGDGWGDALGGATGTLGGAAAGGLVTAFGSSVAARAGASGTSLVATGEAVATGSVLCACCNPQQPAANTHVKAMTVRTANNVAAQSSINLSGSGTTDRTCA